MASGSVQAPADAADVAVTGGLLSEGKLIAGGEEFVGSVRALTDGFAIAQVQAPEQPDQLSFAHGGICTAGRWFTVLGGTVGSWGPGWGRYMDNHQNTLTVPIPAGSTWSYMGNNFSGNTLKSPIEIWWFPMGVGAGEQTYQFLSDDEFADAAPPPPPLSDVRMLADRQEVAGEFLDWLLGSLGAQLDSDARTPLVELLTRL